MKLHELLHDMKYELEQGSDDLEVDALVYDTRMEITGATCFVCIKGAVFDGHEYAKEAVAKGAVVIVAQKRLELSEDVTQIIVEDTRKALASLSAAFFGHPAKKLTIIGITGTKGKTTTSYMVYEMLRQTGFSVGLIGTIETIINETRIPSSHTTPESYVLQELFGRMIAEGITHVVMEVSSQALKLYRVFGFEFYIGVLTNMGKDHISDAEHKTFEEYLECKSRLFKLCRHGIINADDSYADDIIKGNKCETVTTYAVNKEADFHAVQVELHANDGTLGVHFNVSGKKNYPVQVNIPGAFTVYNALTALVIADRLGIEEKLIQDVLSKIQVRGRVELVPVSNQYTVMIDYAHNAMSLESLLVTMREYKPQRLVCMFGCGGNRSKDRRFEMGEISSKLADLTVITSDNPRYEEPDDIIADILIGVKRQSGAFVTIPDRREAIRYCLANAQKGDVILIAGKGHEDYQEIKGVKYPMYDRDMIYEIIKETGGKQI